MTLAMFATGIVVGLLTGALAGFVMKGGGYGLIWDLILGLAGSIAATGIVWMAGGMAPGAGALATSVVAFVGALLVMVGQRKIWYPEA